MQLKTNLKILDAIRWYVQKSKALWLSGGSKRPSSHALEERRDQIIEAMCEFDEFIQWVKLQENQAQYIKRVAVIG